MFKRFYLLNLLLVFILIQFNCAHLKEAKQTYHDQDYKKTIHLCNQAILADSTDGEAYLLLAKAYQKLNQPDSVYQTLNHNRKNILQDPQKKLDVIDLYLFIGMKAYEKEQLRKAYTAINEAEYLKPEEVKQRIQIAKFYYNDGQYSKAKEEFESIHADFPQNETSEKFLSEITQKESEAETFVNKARAAYKKGHFITTQTQCNKALELKPDYNDAKYYLNLAKGRALLKRGDSNNLWEAIEFFGQAMALKPDRAEPHYRMAQAYEKKDEHEFINAIDSYQEALKLDPQGPFAATCKMKINALTKRKEKLDRFWGR